MLFQRPPLFNKENSITTTHTLHLPINTHCQMMDYPFSAPGKKVTYFYALKDNYKNVAKWDQQRYINTTLIAALCKISLRYKKIYNLDAISPLFIWSIRH